MVFDDPNVRYDLILGRQTMKTMELQLDFKEEVVTWLDKQIPFHPTDWYQEKEAIRRVLL